MRARARLLRVAVLLAALILLSRWSAIFAKDPRLNRLRKVEHAFDHAWGECGNDLGGWAATAIDALPTAIIMQKKQVVEQILRLLDSINFRHLKQGTEVQVFEVTIRHLGAMLSAWDLLHGPFSDVVQDARLLDVLLRQMLTLGNALACAFDSPSGIPQALVNPLTCTTVNNTFNTIAGAGSLILEFARLSDIVQDPKFVRLAMKAETHLLSPHPALNEPFPALLGSSINVANGDLPHAQGSWGSYSDSFYEYLLKAAIYDRERFAPYLERWQVAARSTMTQLASSPHGHPEWTLLPFWKGSERVMAMDALSWFAGGNFVLGGMVTNDNTLVQSGLSIADTAGDIYHSTATGLGGEYVWWTETCSADWDEQPCSADNSFKLTSTEFLLRPEALETWYYAYVATSDIKYVEWAWSVFEAIEKFCKTRFGYSTIYDVTEIDGGGLLNAQESYFFAEVLLYIHLILSHDGPEVRAGSKNPWSKSGGHRLWGQGEDEDIWVFNTEGHPLRIAGQPV